MRRPWRECSRRGGLTLIEVLIALAISAMIVVAARFMVEGLSDGARRLRTASLELDREANGIGVARALAGRLETGSPGRTFHGDPTQSAFSSYCEVPEGWLESCRVTLTVQRLGDSTALRALLESSRRTETIELARRAGPLTLRYLLSAEAGGQWILIWEGGLTAPLAIGVVSPTDTLLLRIGVRG